MRVHFHSQLCYVAQQLSNRTCLCARYPFITGGNFTAVWSSSAPPCVSHAYLYRAVMSATTTLYCHPLAGSSVIALSLHRSFLSIRGFEPINHLVSVRPPQAHFMFGRGWLIFLNRCNVSFLSLCTNDSTTEGGVLESGGGGAAWGPTICLVAYQGVSRLQPSHTCHEGKNVPLSARRQRLNTSALC